jgi:hypothetical protein
MCALLFDHHNIRDRIIAKYSAPDLLQQATAPNRGHVLSIASVLDRALARSAIQAYARSNVQGCAMAVDDELPRQGL